jgi:1-acyl-sn-glycerol-3-phosphate acyltransferase
MSKKNPNKLLRLLHSIFLIVWAVISTVVFATLTIASRPFSRNLSLGVARIWIAIMVFVSGVKVDRRGLEKLDRSQTYIFMSNHISALDIPIIQASLPLRTAFMAKRELFFIPFFGWGMAVSGHISVNRQNPVKARRSMERAATTLKTGRNSLIVFPEGTRSRTGELGPFKLGVFSIAIEAGVPIVPIALQGTHEILPRGSYYIKPLPVRLSVGVPVSTSGFDRKNKAILAKLIRDRIEGMLSEKTKRS